MAFSTSVTKSSGCTASPARDRHREAATLRIERSPRLAVRVMYTGTRPILETHRWPPKKSMCKSHVLLTGAMPAFARSTLSRLELTEQLMAASRQPTVYARAYSAFALVRDYGARDAQTRCARKGAVHLVFARRLRAGFTPRAPPSRLQRSSASAQHSQTMPVSRENRTLRKPAVMRAPCLSGVAAAQPRIRQRF
jgi:hypothetical protein